jgi:hypothetical protein
VDGTGSGSCIVVAFGISGVEALGFYATVLVLQTAHRILHGRYGFFPLKFP